MDDRMRRCRNRATLLRVDPVEAMERLGGVATRGELLALSTASRVRTARKRGEVRRVARNRYALPEAGTLRRAAELSGVVSHTSAALHWGWKVKTVPERHVTGKLRTVMDCARGLPFDEALAIADSALRTGGLEGAALTDAASACRGRGAAGVRRVAAHADGRAANPFESVLRAIALDCQLEVLPQQPIAVGDVTLHPDLVDRDRRLVLEADSWTWHASKTAHDRDCWRYNALVVHGWTVLRFTWDQVMHSPTYVADTIDQAVHGPPPDRGRHAA